ncbi:MAG TPA: YceI family protein [Anaerolineaceae bacterium]
MKRVTLSMLIGLCLLLAACAPAATQAVSTSIPDTGQTPAAATQAPTQTTQPSTAPTSAPTTEPAATAAQGSASADVRTYRIVPEQSTVSYSVGEVFFNENNRFNLAVGTTQQVNGEVFLNFTRPEESTVGPITVDISTFTSDSSRRDNAIRGRWLESSRFPLATFTPTQVSGLNADVQAGQTVNLQVTGDLTVRDVTRPVTFAVQVKLENDVLQGSATTEILMTDFGFSPPDIAGMLKAEDTVKIDFTFTAEPA